MEEDGWEAGQGQTRGETKSEEDQATSLHLENSQTHPPKDEDFISETETQSQNWFFFEKSIFFFLIYLLSTGLKMFEKSWILEFNIRHLFISKAC